MLIIVRSTAALLLAGALAGCAADGSITGDLSTSSVNQQAQQQPKVDPVCPALVQHIEELRREGIAEKIEKAANKKYKMTNADLIKADQLNKANGDFQAKCAPRPVQAAAQPAPAPAAAPSVPAAQ
jgi:cell division protein FtsB